MKEAAIKVLLLAKLLKHNPEAIALEVPFSDAGRRADLMMITDQQSYGYEIKGERDNLERLTDQLKDYQGCFDHVYVVSATKHLDKIRTTTPTSIGIIEVYEDKLKIIRQARMKKRLSKKALIKAMDNKTLLQLMASNLPEKRVKNLRSDLLVRMIQREIPTSLCRAHLIDQWIEKYKGGFDTFKKEVGQTILEEDLLNLGLSRRITF